MLIDNDLKLTIEMCLIDMANAVGGILCGHDNNDEKEIRRAHEEYMRMERIVRLALRFLEDAHLKEWDWKYAADHGWLCDMDFKWFKKDLKKEKISEKSYKANWKKWKEECSEPVSEYQIIANAAEVGRKK